MPDPLVSKVPVAVLGTGSSLPSLTLTNDDLLRRAAAHIPSGRMALAGKLARKMGIEQRHVSRDLAHAVEAPRAEDTAPKLAARALRAALTVARTEVEHIQFLIGHTATPHTPLPSNISWVADELGYAGAHTELRQACTGFAAAAFMASPMIAAGNAPIAIVGSETGSVMLDLAQVDADPGQVVNLVQMGDGAGAVLLGPVTSANQSRIEMMYYGSQGLGRAPGLTIRATGSGSPALIASAVPHFHHDYAAIAVHGMELLRAGIQAAARAGFTRESIDWWIPHQVNGRIAELCAAAFGLPEERVLCEATNLGNLGSAAIWVAFDRLRRSGRLKRGQRVLVLGAEATKYLYGGFVYVHGDD